MSETVNPCHCGHCGSLMGQRHSGYFSLTCPECSRSVKAFTMAGLIEEWNKPAGSMLAAAQEIEK